jgi:hypothetical protein
MDEAVPLRHARHPLALAMAFFLILDSAHNQLLAARNNIFIQSGLKSAED